MAVPPNRPIELDLAQVSNLLRGLPTGAEMLAQARGVLDSLPKDPNDPFYSDWKGETGPGAVLRESIRQENEARMSKTATPPLQKTQIAPDVIQMIRSGTWYEDKASGMTALTMPMTKDRALYKRTADLLKNFGGKWSRQAKAILFDDEDAATSVVEACANGFYIDLKKAYQFFETPPDVAQRLVNELDMNHGTLEVLEPSAGRGALIRAVAKADNADHPDLHINVTAVECNPDMERPLRDMMGSSSCVLNRLIMSDFLNLDPEGPEGIGYFDRIIMNPPFAKSQDIKHVRHAFKFLKPGGTMVAVMSPGFTFRQDTTASLFREWLQLRGSMDRYYGWVPLPNGSFTVSGTNVNTVYLVISKGK